MLVICSVSSNKKYDFLTTVSFLLNQQRYLTQGGRQWCLRQVSKSITSASYDIDPWTPELRSSHAVASLTTCVNLHQDRSRSFSKSRVHEFGSERTGERTRKKVICLRGGIKTYERRFEEQETDRPSDLGDILSYSKILIGGFWQQEFYRVTYVRRGLCPDLGDILGESGATVHV